MSKRRISSVLTTKNTLHDRFVNLPKAKQQSVLARIGSGLPSKRCIELYDSWRDIIHYHEGQTYNEIYGMDAVARRSYDVKNVKKLFNYIRQSCIVMRSFNAIDDYGLSTMIREYGSEEAIRHANRSDDWSQQLLHLLSNAPEQLARNSHSLTKRPKGRPLVKFRHDSANRLVRTWRNYGLPEPSSAGGRKAILGFYDEVTNGIEHQFHAAWSSHTLSPRWPSNSDQPLTAPEIFSDELGKLRVALAKRARAPCQHAPDE